MSDCSNRSKAKLIQGTWKIDSAYTFYNGYDFVQKSSNGNWPTYHYNAEGIVKEIKSGTFQSYLYSFNDRMDTLLFYPTRGGKEIKYTILKLRKDQMILKRSRDPIFKGKNQERYEIRYFSATDDPDQYLTPFGDPRELN